MRFAVKARFLPLICLPLFGVIWIMDIPSYMGWSAFREQYLGVFVALTLIVVYLKHGRWYDIALASVSLVLGVYIAILYPVASKVTAYTPIDQVLLGTAAIILVLEATRRVAGLPLMVVTGVFIMYASFSNMLPAILVTTSFSWNRVSCYLYLDPNGMLGIPLIITSTIVLAFILFGQMLLLAKGGEFLTQLALATMGGQRGGPAKVAVLGSAFFASISGSIVANVVATGSVTIPLMKKTGFPPHVAGAVEAVASSGGVLTPPVMGPTGFLIAEFLRIPYRTVAVAAALPSILYYLTLWLQIDRYAAKEGIHGLPKKDLPSISQVLKSGWVFSIPIMTLIYTLFFLNMSPAKSALLSSAIILCISLWRYPRQTISGLFSSLTETGEVLSMLGVVALAAGFIIGIFSLTGLGFNITYLLLRIGEVNFWSLVAVVIFAAILLGSCMTELPVYVLLVILVAPSLEKAGVIPIAAHLFVFYYGILSMITPPVALASYTAAAIAQADFWKTSLKSLSFALGSYIVPLLFLREPALLLNGTPLAILEAFGRSVIGLAAIIVGYSGYLFTDLKISQRLLFVVGGLAVVPLVFTDTTFENIAITTGLAILLASILWLRLTAKMSKHTVLSTNRR